MPLTIDACVAHHRGDRAEQQDRVGVFVHPRRPDLLLAVLADGMGGRTGGAHAAGQVLVHARQAFEAHVPGRHGARALLENIVESAHLAIRLSRFLTGLKPRSTIAALLLQPQRVDWVHCGDSRIYRFAGDGRLLGRSEDHSIVERLIGTGRMPPSSARDHPRRHVLLSCLGGESAPDRRFGALEKLGGGDHFLLCSDGLWNQLSDAEMGLALAVMPARQAAQQLLECARKRSGGQGDNVSLAVIRCVESDATSVPDASAPMRIKTV